MTKFTPHSTRMAATSKAWKKEVPITTILKTVGWRRASTFTKFYKRPIEETEAVGDALLRSDTDKTKKQH